MLKWLKLAKFILPAPWWIKALFGVVLLLGLLLAPVLALLVLLLLPVLGLVALIAWPVRGIGHRIPSLRPSGRRSVLQRWRS